MGNELMGNELSPAAGDELAQGTPGEPDSPAGGDFAAEPAAPGFGDLVAADLGTDAVRLGIFLGDGVVLWLGEPAPCDLPLRKVG